MDLAAAQIAKPSGWIKPDVQQKSEDLKLQKDYRITSDKEVRGSDSKDDCDDVQPRLRGDGCVDKTVEEETLDINDSLSKECDSTNKEGAGRVLMQECEGSFKMAPVNKIPLDLQEAGEKEERKRKGSELEKPLRYSFDYDERSLVQLDNQQVQEQEELQKDYAVNDGSSLEEQVVSEKVESSETITQEDASVRVNNRELTNFDELGKSTCKKKDMEEPIISKYKEGEIAKQGDSQEKKVQKRAPVSPEEKVEHPDEMLYYGRRDRNDDHKNKDQTVLKETGECERPKPEISIIEEPLKYTPDNKASLLEYPERHQGAAQENDQGKQEKEEGPSGAQEKVVYVEKMQHRQRQDQHDDSLNKNRLLLQESEGKEELNREGYEFEGSKLDKGLECSSDYKGKAIENSARQQGEKQIEEQQDDAVNDKNLVEQAVIEKAKSSEKTNEIDAAVSVNNSGITSSDELGKSTGNRTDKSESILPKYKEGDDSQGKQMQEKASESCEEKVVYSNKIKYHANVENSAVKEAGDNIHPKSEVASIEESLKSSPDYEDDYQDDYQVKRIQETAAVDHKEQVVHPHEIQDHDPQNDITNENSSALQETGEKEEPKGNGSEHKEHFTCSHDFQESSLEQPEREQVLDRKKLQEGNTVNREILMEQTVSDRAESLETIIEEDTSSVSLNNDDGSEEEVGEKALVGHEEKVVEEIQDKDKQDQCDVLTKKDLSTSPFLETDENEDAKLKASKIKAPLKSSLDHDESSLDCTERQQENVATEGHYQVKQVNEKGPLSHDQKNGHLDEMRDRDRHDQQVDPTKKQPSVLQETGQNEEPKPEVSTTEEPLKSSPDYEGNSLEYTEEQQEDVATEDDSQEKQVEDKGPLSHEEKNGHLYEMQDRDRHDQPVDLTNKEPSLLEETGQSEEPKPEVSKTEKPLKSSPDRQESSLEYTEGQQEKFATEDNFQEKQVEEKGPLSHYEKNGRLDAMQDRDRHDQQVDPTNKEPSVLQETGQNEELKPEMFKIEEPFKYSPERAESSLEYTEGQQEEVATEGDSQEKQVKENGPLSREEKNGRLDAMQDRDRHNQQIDPTNKKPSVLQETGQNEELKPEVSKVKEPLKSTPDHEESTLEYTEGQQEKVATEGDSQETQVKENGSLSHEEKNGNLHEVKYRDRHDLKDDPTIEEPSCPVLEERGQNEETKPEVSKIGEPLKSSPVYEESSRECTEGQQQEFGTEGDSQEKQVKENGSLSHGEKNGHLDEMQDGDRHDQQVDLTNKEPSVLQETGQNEEPKHEVSKIEEPLKPSPDHKESSFGFTEGQQEKVATEGDSQEKQVKEQGLLTHKEKNGHLDEMQDRDRHDLRDDPTIKEPSVLDETRQNKEPKSELSKIEEPLKSSPDHEESSLEYSEGQQEEVATECDSQAKQVKENDPLSHEQKIVHLDEMQDHDRHDRKDGPTNKEPSVLDETRQNKEPKPKVPMIEEPLKSSPNYDENSFEHPGRQQGVVATQDDSQSKREQENAPMSHEEKCSNHEKIQHYDRHDQHDDRTNKLLELQETGENEELKREGSNLDDPVRSNSDKEEMSLEHTERQQVQEKKELRENETVKGESLVEQPVSDQTESIQTTIEDDAVVTVNNQEITNSNELWISNGKQTDKRELVLTKYKEDEVARQDDSQQVQGEAPVSHGEKVVHLRTIQDYDAHSMHDEPSNNAQSKSVLPETGESKETTLEEYKIEERLKLNPDYKESSFEYLEMQRKAATQNDSEEKKVEEKLLFGCSYEERSLHPGEMQDHDQHIKLDNSKNKDQSVLQETSENEKPKVNASKIEEPLKSFSNNEDRTLECLERQQIEVATQDDSAVKQVQDKALVGHKEQVTHPGKMQDLDRQDQQYDSTSKYQSVLQGKEERKREGLERKELLESSYNFEERLLENLEREQVKNQKNKPEDNAVNGGSVVEQADSDKTESLEKLNEEDTFVSLNNLENSISDDDDFQAQQERDISFVGHEEKVLEEILDKDLIEQHQYGDLTNKGLTVLQETSESKEPKLKATKIEAPLKSTPDYEECSLEYSEKQQEEFDSQDKQVKEKGPLTHEQKIVPLDEMQDLGRHDQQDDPTKKEPSVLQEIGENEEPKLEDSELEELKIEEPLRSSSDYEQRSLEYPDSNKVQQQQELQKDDVVGENVVEQEVIDKTESIETTIEDISFSASNRVAADSDEFGKPSSKQTNTTDPILSTCKENEVPLQGDSQNRPVKKEAPVCHEGNVVYPEKVEVHDGFYLQDDPANNYQPVVQITNKNKKLKFEEPIKPSFDNEEWSEKKESPVTKKRKSAISFLWCWCCG